MSLLHLVIHASPKLPEATWENFRIAKEEGADGVFLISHDGDENFLLDIADEVVRREIKIPIGVNFLGLEQEYAFDVLNDFPVFSSLWADNSYVGVNEQVVKGIHQARIESGWKGKYWSGCAFKYQKQPEDLVATVKEAKKWMDVIVTSGPATGEPPSVEKLKVMRQAAGKHKIAVASGISSENVEGFLTYVDHFMVATGVSKSFLEFDSQKVAKLRSLVK